MIGHIFDNDSVDTVNDDANNYQEHGVNEDDDEDDDLVDDDHDDRDDDQGLDVFDHDEGDLIGMMIDSLDVSSRLDGLHVMMAS